jgi:prepilin-type N-terminal cleavage/methylation domain-containing protein
MFKRVKVSKRGFTLLETMLSVAILLIVTLMVYEGFMSTLNYSGDTALADRLGNEAAGQCYEQLGTYTNGTSPKNKANVDANAAIIITGSGVKSVLQVQKIAATNGDSAFSATSLGSALSDDSSFTNTTNRHGFAYCARTCPEHPNTVLQYYKTTISGSEAIVARCSQSGCSYSSTGANKNALVVSWG